MKSRINFSSKLSLLKNVFFIYTLLLLLVIPSCEKDSPTPPPPAPESGLHVTIIDNQTGSPVDSAYVGIGYGNTFSCSGFTGADGKFSCDIPEGWVLNEITITKAGYCTYLNYPNTTEYVHNQTINIDHYAYLRYHVKNLAPAVVTDKLVIYSPNPVGTSGFQFDFLGASVDSTFVTVSSAGNLGISCNIFVGSTFISSFYTYVTAIGGDTVDVAVDY